LLKATKGNRWGHRDSTMILVAYRHGLRASELTDLRWDQIDFATATLHVRRVKQGSPSTHPILGDELRSLRRLQQEQGPKSPFVFTSERGSPFTTAGFARMVERAGVEAKFGFKVTSTHAAARLRVRIGLQGPRHPGASGVPRAQEHPAHRAIYRAVAYALQGLLAGLTASALGTKAALAARKAMGKVLGGPKLAEARMAAQAVIRDNADRYDANVLPIIREAQRAGLKLCGMPLMR
jgi:Phage integrase family